MMNKWTETERGSFFYYREADGLVIGQAHRFGTQTILHTARIYKENDEKILGQYINSDSARRAIEKFWDIENRTLVEFKE